MKRSTLCAVLTACLVLVGAAQAQDEITIKLKERGQGESIVVERKQTTTTRFVVRDGTGNVLADKADTKGELHEFKETVLARAAGKPPTKVERVYSKSDTTSGGTTTASPLSGKTVLIVKTGDKYEFAYKGGEVVTGLAATLLANDFGKKTEANSRLDKLMLPPGPVKVGGTWKIDMKKIVAEIAGQEAMEIDAPKATGVGTLVKTYMKDDRQFGVMKYKIEMPILTTGKGNERLKFAAGAKIAMDLDLDACIDGTAEAGTMKMAMRMSGNADAAGGATVALTVSMDATETQSEPKK